MTIVPTRRISQAFFFALFIWFCIVSTIGIKWWQIRSWPVNLFLQLDPLVAIGTVLTTHKLYQPLLWALATIVPTIILGRFFCGWVCPFGSLHHFVGFIANKSKTTAEKIHLNKYRSTQSTKYFILIFLLATAALPSAGTTLQTGLLDPIPLASRFFNLVIVPITDRLTNTVSVTPRFYEGAWLTATIVLSTLTLNLVIPRFYCRFVCPLGAIFAIIGRSAIWRIGKNTNNCTNCQLCETHCEGGCEPNSHIKIAECILCFNCRRECGHETISYQKHPSASGEQAPNISRRGILASIASGIVAAPAIGLSNKLGSNWYYRTIRPPGALTEKEFLKRCIKCGQCIRICPTNVLQPAGIYGGLEGLWTPVLNNRIGSSGCQLNCVACGQICPTAAIRPITLNEKLGKGQHADAGPIKLGTAFVDRSKCLPWAMDKPCIVCQENCPVSPKAIYTQEVFTTIRAGILTTTKANQNEIETAEKLTAARLASGDYYCLTTDGEHKKIKENTENKIILAGEESFERIPQEGSKIQIQIRVQRPYVDIEKCIGCGVCEHECPISGKGGIRVSAEGETRSTDRVLLLIQKAATEANNEQK